MPGNPILVLAPSDELRGTLEQALTASGHGVRAVTTTPDAVAALRDGHFDLVVAEGLAVSGAITFLKRAQRDRALPILVVSPAGDVEARIAFLEAGANDVIATGFSRRELEGRIQALLIRTGLLQPVIAPKGLARLVTFLAAKGGVGTTALAVNSALLLAGRDAAEGAGSRVLLIDLDLQFGQAATHLNLRPTFDIGGLVADEIGLQDRETATTYLTRHPTGLQVLAAPASPDVEARIGMEQVEQILSVFRPAFDTIVVDLGHRIDIRSLWLLEQADATVVVVVGEFPALRASKDLLTFLAANVSLRAPVHVAFNHMTGREQLTARDAEGILGIRPTVDVPGAARDMTAAVNAGVPLVLSRPNSPASRALERLVSAISGIQAAEVVRAPQPQPRRGTLFSRR